MPPNRRHIPLKERSKLHLRKPDLSVAQLDVELRTAILGFVDHHTISRCIAHISLALITDPHSLPMLSGTTDMLLTASAA